MRYLELIVVAVGLVLVVAAAASLWGPVAVLLAGVVLVVVGVFAPLDRLRDGGGRS